MPKSVNFLCLESKLSRVRARKFDAIKRKNPVAVVCGHGRLSTVRVRSVLGGNLARGCMVVHGGERAHNGAFWAVATESEAYNAGVRDLVDLKRMAMLNKPLLVG